MKSLFVILTLLLAGCGSTGPIKGRFVDSAGAGIPNADVVCWKRQGFMKLPLRVAETKTDQEGRFEVIAGDTVHSITARTPDTFEKMRHGSVSLHGRSAKEIVIKEEPISERSDSPERESGRGLKKPGHE